MQRAEVVVVAGKILGAGFPVRVDHEALRWTEYLDPVLIETEDKIEVPLHSAEIFLERRRGPVERGEDQAMVGCKIRNTEQAVLFLRHAAESVFRQRRAKQVALSVVGPAVIRTSKNIGVARIRAADLNAAMPASVKQRMDFSILIAHHNEIIFADFAADVVA